MRLSSVVFFLVGLLLMPVGGLAQGPEESWAEMRERSESQFEIVQLLIKQEKYDQVLKETEELFAHPFPEAQEHRLEVAANRISQSLAARTQFRMALQVLEQALKVLKGRPHKAKVFKEMAYLCKKMGDDEKAMEYFEKSLEMQKSL